MRIRGQVWTRVKDEDEECWSGVKLKCFISPLHVVVAFDLTEMIDITDDDVSRT